MEGIDRLRLHMRERERERDQVCGMRLTATWQGKEKQFIFMLL